MCSANFRPKILYIVLTNPVEETVIQTEKFNKFMLWQCQNLNQTDLTGFASEIEVHSTIIEVVLDKDFIK